MSRLSALGLSLLALCVGCGTHQQENRQGAQKHEVVRLSAQELKQAAEGICRGVTIQLAEIAESTKGIPGNPRQVLAATRAGFSNLKRLHPPPQLTGRFENFLIQVQRREQQRRDILTSLSNPTPRLGLAVRQFNYFTARANNAARHLHLKVCPGF
jgi:hypothetical protein